MTNLNVSFSSGSAGLVSGGSLTIPDQPSELYANAAVTPTSAFLPGLTAAAAVGGTRALAQALVSGGSAAIAFLGSVNASTLLAPLVVGTASFAAGYLFGSAHKDKMKAVVASVLAILESNKSPSQKTLRIAKIFFDARTSLNQVSPGSANTASNGSGKRSVQSLDSSILETKTELKETRRLRNLKPNDTDLQIIERAQIARLQTLEKEKSKQIGFTQPIKGTNPVAVRNPNKTNPKELVGTYTAAYQRARDGFASTDQANSKAIEERYQHLSKLILDGHEPPGARKAYEDLVGAYQARLRHEDRLSQLYALGTILQTSGSPSVKDPETGLVLNSKQIKEHQTKVQKERVGLNAALLAKVAVLDKALSNDRLLSDRGNGVYAPELPIQPKAEDFILKSPLKDPDLKLPGYTRGVQKNQEDPLHPSLPFPHPNDLNPLAPVRKVNTNDTRKSRDITNGNGSLLDGSLQRGVVMKSEESNSSSWIKNPTSLTELKNNPVINSVETPNVLVKDYSPSLKPKVESFLRGLAGDPVRADAADNMLNWWMNALDDGDLSVALNEGNVVGVMASEVSIDQRVIHLLVANGGGTALMQEAFRNSPGRLTLDASVGARAFYDSLTPTRVEDNGELYVWESLPQRRR